MRKIVSISMMLLICLSMLPIFITRVKAQEPIFTLGVKIQAAGQDLKIDAQTPALSTFVIDWNNDGRKDLLLGTYYPAYVYLFLNIGTDESPVFGEGTKIQAGGEDLYVPDPVPSTAASATPFAVDWNNDGKKDLLIGTFNSVLLYTNVGTDSTPEFEAEPSVIQASGTRPGAGTYAQPFVADWNNDDKKDLLVGHSGHLNHAYIDLYINIGTDASPSFGDPSHIQAAGQDISQSYGSAPFVVDWNNDSKKDLIVRETRAFTVYINVGSDMSPVFGEGAKIQAGGEDLYVSVGDGVRMFSVTDWNNDGIHDLVIGDYDGYVLLFMGSSDAGILWLLILLILILLLLWLIIGQPTPGVTAWDSHPDIP